MNEEQRCIDAAIMGDSEAFKQMFKKYQPVVFSVQKRYFLKMLDHDDWQQEGQIIFFHSLKTYQASRGLSIGAFFKMNFERHIFSLLRKQGAEKRKTDTMSSSLEEIIDQKGEYSVFRESETFNLGLQYILIRDSLIDFVGVLSKFEEEVFRAYLLGQSFQAIAVKLMCSEAKVKNGLDRIKSKFKAVITS